MTVRTSVSSSSSSSSRVCRSTSSPIVSAMCCGAGEWCRVRWIHSCDDHRFGTRIQLGIAVADRASYRYHQRKFMLLNKAGWPLHYCCKVMPSSFFVFPQLSAPFQPTARQQAERIHTKALTKAVTTAPLHNAQGARSAPLCCARCAPSQRAPRLVPPSFAPAAAAGRERPAQPWCRSPAAAGRRTTATRPPAATACKGANDAAWTTAIACFGARRLPPIAISNGGM